MLNIDTQTLVLKHSPRIQL